MKDAKGHGSAAHQAGTQQIGRMAGWGGALADQVRRFAKSEAGSGNPLVPTKYHDDVAGAMREADPQSIGEGFGGLHTLDHITHMVGHLSHFFGG